MKTSKKSFSLYFKHLLPVAVIALFISIFFWKVFVGLVPFPGDFVTGIYPPWTDYSTKWGYPAGVPVKNPLTADVPSFIYPMQTFAFESVTKGDFGLWNPYILAGNPLMANFQSIPYSPLNFLYLFLNKIDAWSLQVILGHFFAVLFTYLLLRSWKLSRSSSFVGGLIFGFSGFNLIWSQWNGHTLTASFIPLVILCAQKYLLGNKIVWGVALSLALFMQMISGYPQVVMYTYLCLGLLWIANFKFNFQYLIKTLGLGIFVVLSVSLASFQNMPGKELLSLSQRDNEPLGYEIAFLHLKQIISFVAPDFYGNPATGNYWGLGDYTVNAGFVGVVALFLAFIGNKINSQKKFIYLLLLTSLLLSLPTFLSLFIWNTGFLGLQAASAHRALVLFNFSVALLAGFGFESLVKNKSSNIYKSLFAIFILLSIFTYWAYSINQIIAIKNLILPWFIFFALFLLIILIKKKFNFLIFVILLLCVFELFRFGWKFTPFSSRELVFPTTPEIEYLMTRNKPVRIFSNAIPINLRMAYHLESLEGYDAVYSSRMSKFLAVLSSNNPNATPHNRYGQVDNMDTNLLSLSNVGYLLVKKEGAQPKNPNYKKVFEGPSTIIYKNLDVSPRAFVVTNWDIEKDDLQTLNKLVDSNFPLKEKIILEKGINFEQSNNNSSMVQYIEYSANNSKISVYSQNPGMLLISDIWYPGWNAKVDGVKKEIYRADYVYRAIPIPAGNSVVEMYYRPNSFVIGIFLSILSAILLIIILAFKRIWDYTLKRMKTSEAKKKTAEELHKNVPPDWYFASMKRNLLQKWWHVSRFREVEKAIDEVDGIILDIGSADGMFTNVISKKSKAKQVIGIDVLPQSVKWANKHWAKTNMKFKVGNAHKLDFKTNSLDAVFALEVLEHVHEPLNVLKEIKRVLKKDGYAVFLVPSDNDLFLFIWFLVKKFWWARIWEDTHLQSYRNGKLTKLSKKAGFKVEKDKKFWLGMLHLIKVRKTK